MQGPHGRKRKVSKPYVRRGVIETRNDYQILIEQEEDEDTGPGDYRLTVAQPLRVGHGRSLETALADLVDDILEGSLDE